MTGPGLREQKREATERALARAACDLVLAHGLADVTVDDIVSEVGVSRRTFSNYFANKEEALAAVLVHQVSDGLDTWVAPPSARVTDLLRDLVRHQLSTGALQPMARLAPLARAHPSFLPHFREAQWRVWRQAGERVRSAASDADAADTETADLEAAGSVTADIDTATIDTAVAVSAAMGAVFGVVSTAVGEGFSDDPPEGPQEVTPSSVGQALLAALDLLERGLG